MSKFFCGVGKALITPPIGTKLFGYRPDVVSTSVNDDLNVTAAAFSDGETTCLLLSATVCEIANEVSDSLRKAVAERTGLPFDHIVLHAIHTHSAPNCVGMAGWGGIDEEYVNGIFKDGILKAAVRAVASMKEAELGIGTVHSEVGINRRQIMRNGDVILGQNPYGVYDPEMTVLAFRTVDGTPLLNIVHYGCHGTGCGCNQEISRDWSGVMVDGLERESGAVTTFIDGAEGDVGPRLSNGQTVGDLGYALRLGAVAESDAVKAYRSIRHWEKDPELKLHIGDIVLPYKPLMPLDEVKKELKKYPEPEKLINIDYLEYDRLKKIEAIHEGKRAEKPNFTYRSTIIEVGGAAIVPFPFEIFSEISLRMRDYSKKPHVLCLSCTNGSNAYLPTRGELLRGGYEIRTFTAGDAQCLRDDTDDIIIDQNLKLMGE